MNPGMEFVLFIILITTVGSIFKARYGHRQMRDDRDDGALRGRRGRRALIDDVEDSDETQRLKEELRALKDRLHVLERITVEKESTLNREIDRLRDR